METTQLKAHVFDAEQAIRWARDAIDAGDLGAIKEAITSAGTAVAQAREVLESATAQRPQICAENHRPE